MTVTTRSLNLSTRYIPNWGAWEVVREQITNAMDADPEHHDVSFISDDRVTITTSTIPELSDLLIIGEGTKDRTTDTIGQFGEGFKLSALVVLRSGGSLRVLCPTFVLTFSLQDDLGKEVLHVHIHEGHPDCYAHGSIVEVTMTNIGVISKARFRPQDPSFLITKTRSPSPLTFYYRGIYVTQERDLHSYFDYNLHDVTINRDRSVVNSSDAMSEVRKNLVQSEPCPLTQQDVDSIYTDTNSYEHSVVFPGSNFAYDVSPPSPSFIAHLRQVIRDHHGAKHVLSYLAEPRYNLIASGQGYTIIQHNHSKLQFLHDYLDIPYANKVVSLPKKRKEVPILSSWYARIDDIHTILRACGLAPTIRAFTFNEDMNTSDARCLFTSGRAGDLRLWIHQDLFTTPEDDFLRDLFIGLASANITSNSQFAGENALAFVGTSLAKHLLDLKHGRTPTTRNPTGYLPPEDPENDPDDYGDAYQPD